MKNYQSEHLARAAIGQPIEIRHQICTGPHDRPRGIATVQDGEIVDYYRAPRSDRYAFKRWVDWRYVTMRSLPDGARVAGAFPAYYIRYAT